MLGQVNILWVFGEGAYSWAAIGAGIRHLLTPGGTPYLLYSKVLCVNTTSNLVPFNITGENRPNSTIFTGKNIP